MLAPCLNVFAITVPAAAAAAAARWTRVNIPAGGETGGWALADGSDIRHLTLAADGTLYAYGEGLTDTLLKSTDGGLKWSGTGKVQGVIQAIAVSPYNTNFIYYATEASVYRSTDGGKSFSALPDIPGGAGTGNVAITSIAAGWQNGGNIIAAGTRDTDSAQYGGVYLLDDAAAVPSWTDSNIGNYDVYAVAFPPSYAADPQITAVATDETDTYVFSKTGSGGWSGAIGAAKLNRDNAAPPTAVAIGESAAIAFPDNYTGDAGSPECFFYVGIDTGAGNGDVYKIECANAPADSTATDLDTGGSYGADNTDITGLAAYSDGKNVTLLAGAAASAVIYISTDGGTSWKKSRKPPTGEKNTYVLFSPDFSAAGLAYAATGGGGSALSVSRDGGENWSQVSLIDTAISNIVDIAPSPGYSQDNTLFMITFGSTPSSGGLWKTADGGLAWERILSGVHTGVATLSRIGLPPEYGAACQTLYIAGESGGNTAIWESDDGGRRFRVRLVRDPDTGASIPLDAWTVAGENLLFIGSYDGAHGLIYQTTNGGLSMTEGTPAGANSIYSIAISPDYINDGTILAGNSHGMVYKSMDGGASFVPLPPDTAAGSLADYIDVTFDPDFKENRTIYAGSTDTDAGCYRLNIDNDDYWESIDGTLPSNAVINRLAVADTGVLYGVNSHADGGLERCLDPKAASPLFETVTRGLSDGATLTGIRRSGSQLWAIDTTNGKLMTYKDTLTLPVTQTSPENGAAGIGSLVDHAVQNITLDWEAVEGATSYQWQCTYNTDFSAIPSGLEETIDASSVHLPDLDPATLYYWRVRVSAPVLSPWSVKQSFTTSLDTQVVALKPESPVAGAADVAIRPVFQWTAVVGASSYELLVADDAAFENPVIIKINEYALSTNAWECDVSLDYDTTYYWKVRATTAGTHSTWSSAGIFTTEAVPPLFYEDFNDEAGVRLLDGQDSMMMLSPAKKTASAEPLLPPPASAAPPVTIRIPDLNEQSPVPNWIIYLIGGLLAIVFLALTIILAVVLKIKRF